MEAAVDNLATQCMQSWVFFDHVMPWLGNDNKSLAEVRLVRHATLDTMDTLWLPPQAEQLVVPLARSLLGVETDRSAHTGKPLSMATLERDGSHGRIAVGGGCSFSTLYRALVDIQTRPREYMALVRLLSRSSHFRAALDARFQEKRVDELLERVDAPVGVGLPRWELTLFPRTRSKWADAQAGPATGEALHLLHLFGSGGGLSNLVGKLGHGNDMVLMDPTRNLRALFQKLTGADGKAAELICRLHRDKDFIAALADAAFRNGEAVTELTEPAPPPKPPKKVAMLAPSSPSPRWTGWRRRRVGRRRRRRGGTQGGGGGRAGRL